MLKASETETWFPPVEPPDWALTSLATMKFKEQKIISVMSWEKTSVNLKLYIQKKKKIFKNGARNPGIFQTSTNQEHLWPAALSLKDILKEAFQAKKKDPLKVESPSEETVSK